VKRGRSLAVSGALASTMLFIYRSANEALDIHCPNSSCPEIIPNAMVNKVVPISAFLKAMRQMAISMSRAACHANARKPHPALLSSNIHMQSNIRAPLVFFLSISHRSCSCITSFTNLSSFPCPIEHLALDNDSSIKNLPT